MNCHKVTIELEWEQIDAIMVGELRAQIEMMEKENREGVFLHPDDRLSNENLLPAMYKVYEYWAGEEAAEELMAQEKDKEHSKDETRTD